jgi:hypothetical protein
VTEVEMFKNAGEDWLSCTIRTVEAVMERHGFEEDEKPAVDISAKRRSDDKLSPWNKLLRAAGKFRTSE